MGRIVTEDIVRILPKAETFALIYAFLSTKVGHSLLLSTAFGTSIPGMRLDLVQALPVPQVSKEQNQRLTDHVHQSIAARVVAASAEDEAVRILEDEVLPRWLG